MTRSRSAESMERMSARLTMRETEWQSETSLDVGARLACAATVW